MRTLIVAGLVVLAAGSWARAAESIAASDAAKFVGQTQTVCGAVSGARYLADSNRKPTFINFDKPFPRHTFTAIVPGASRDKFKDPPEKAYHGKTICVTGLIKLSHGKPEIEVTDPAQIAVQEAPAAAEPAKDAAPEKK